jgi:hypothetical protein
MHLAVQLADVRTVSVPLDWYRRLAAGSPPERNRWELIGNGSAIHLPDLDEDLTVEGILAVHRSGESKQSFTNWLKLYRRGERGFRIAAAGMGEIVGEICRTFCPSLILATRCFERLE